MKDVQFRIRTPDQTREAEITADRGSTGRELIALAAAKWQMPTDTEYRLQNTSRHAYIQPEQKLSEDVVGPQDVLQVEPVLVAGGSA
ncbi:MAG: hypothetical protein JOY64_04505 [Alphaproteobacteria bacterium]|nr:hypothetical protein [Alphaproteobacteria bacterium]MBV8406869.1 hypothetical protein [Alphaproteobacteria bacterium]